MLTVGGLFSGIGGIELGFEQAGFKINWSNEIDENCAKTFKFNHKHELIVEDIGKINFKKLKPVDVLYKKEPPPIPESCGTKEGKSMKKCLSHSFFYDLKKLKDLDKVN